MAVLKGTEKPNIYESEKFENEGYFRYFLEYVVFVKLLNMVPYYYISTSRGWRWGWGWGWGRRWHKGANSSGVYSREALDAPFCSSEICSNSQRAEGAKQESKMREKFLMKFLIIYLNLCFVVSLSSATLVWKPLSLHFPDLPAKFGTPVLLFLEKNVAYN